MAFIDFKKGFQIAYRNLLFGILTKDNVSYKLIKEIYNTYKVNLIATKFGTEYSERGYIN